MRNLVLAALLFATPASAEPTGVTSAYTKLDLDSCAAVDPGDEPAWMEWECDGYEGVALFVQSGDDRYDLDAGVRDQDEHWAETFDYPADTVEWRLKDGRPFAIIYRLRNANPDRPTRSELVVETVGAEARPGCRVAKIDGAAKDANLLARRAADALLLNPATCLKSE